MCREQIITSLPNHLPKKINKAPWKIFYTENMEKFLTVQLLTKLNFDQENCINVYFAFYNMDYIQNFTYMLNVVWNKTIMICLFPTEYRRYTVRIIRFILTTFNNEQHPWKRVRVEKYGASENSTYVTKLLVYGFIISKETTGGDTS